MSAYSFDKVADFLFPPDTLGRISAPVIDASGVEVFSRDDGPSKSDNNIPKYGFELFRGNGHGATPDLIYQDQTAIGFRGIPYAVSGNGIIVYPHAGVATDDSGFEREVDSIYSWDAGKTSVLVKALPPDSPSPDEVGTQLSEGLSINDDGTLLVHTIDAGGQNFLFLGSSQEPLQEIDLDASSLTEPVYSALNSSGTVVLIALDFLTLTALTEGVYVSNNGNITSVLNTEDGFGSFSNPVINDRGDVAFLAFPTAGGAVLMAGAPNHLSAAADTAGPFSGFQSVAINAKGSLAFEAFLKARDNGIYTGPDGIYTGPDPTTDKVVAKGDALFGSTVTSLAMTSNALNDNGQIAFEATLADGRQVIVRADPVAGPDIAATPLTLDTSQGGVDFGYTISGVDLPHATNVALYWAPDSTFDKSKDKLVQGSVTTTQTAVGAYSLHIDGASLTGAPAGTSYLLAVTDPDNTLGGFDPQKSVMPLQLKLDVPYENQADSLWGSQLLGASKKVTIANSGCALTSYAMALQFLGVGTDPYSLNVLLTQTPDGYAPNKHGVKDILNWSRAAVYATQAAGEPLIWNSFKTSDPQSLRDIITSTGSPIIVGVTNPISGHQHFVLVTGIVGNTFYINDPGYSGRTTLDSYGNKFETRGYITDPPGDLSALDFALSSGESGPYLSVTDQMGNTTGVPASGGQPLSQIPDSIYFVDGPLEDLSGQDTDDSITQFVYITQPGHGTFYVNSNGNGAFILSASGISPDDHPLPAFDVSGTSSSGVLSQIKIIYDPQQGLNIQNISPKLAAISDQSIVEGSTMTVPITAADSDIGQTLHFSLDPGAPTGARIDPVSGVFNWTPTTPGKYTLTVRVTDNGSPPLSVARSFAITVKSIAPNIVSYADVISSLGNPTYGQSLYFGAAVGAFPGLGNPTGTFHFVLDGSYFGAPIAIVNGAAISPSLATLAAGVHHVAAVYSGDANYAAIVSPILTKIVTKAPLTIVASSATKVYGRANPPIFAAGLGFVLGQSLANLAGVLNVATTATVGSHVGSYPVTASGLTSANYAITYVRGTMVVTPAPLMIWANSATRAYGQPNPLLSASYFGFVNGDTPASLTTPVVLWAAASPFSPVGIYGIAAYGASSPDYAITFFNGSLAVTPPPVGATPITQEWTAFATTLYEEILGRNPDSDGLAFWVQMLSRRVPPATVALAIWNSPEHNLLLATNRAPRIALATALTDAQTAGQLAFGLTSTFPRGPLSLAGASSRGWW